MSSPAAAPASSYLKWVALATLCVQNTALILSMRYSRSVLHDTYLDSTIVIMMEMVKFIASTALVFRDGGNIKHLFELIRTSGWISIPSIMYVVQNTCQLVAVKNLDASTFSVLSQAKVLTTAVCSILFLKVTLSLRKWRALALLVLGCILVQSTPPECNSIETEAEQTAKANSIFLGLTMTLIMVCISGIAGVTIEKILKNQGSGMAQMTLWERNVQLSFWGMIFATGSLLLRDFDRVSEKGFFDGWSGFAVIVVICQSVGGLVTAVVVKYTNTIIKGFAVGLSVVFTSILSIALFNSELTLIFWSGAIAVLLSIFNFGEEDVPVATPSAELKKHAPFPGTPEDIERVRLIEDGQATELARTGSAGNLRGMNKV